MNPALARQLIKDTFTQAFDKTRFRTFAINLLNHVDEGKVFARNSPYIKEAFRAHVHRFERLGTYTSPDGEKVDVLIVHLTVESKLERARTAIRNFVADHLKIRDEKDAALVAFVSPTEKQWRASYVKMEYGTVEKESGKIGVKTRLTPARRFSYLVGEDESCHTAQTRFLDLLQDTTTDPTLEQIEEAFSVEAVTKEFFTKYAELFEGINEALEKLVVKDKKLLNEFNAKGVNTVDFAKKLMGQIVFLYFLQKKGWLGVEKGNDWGTGPRNFLRRLAREGYGEYNNFFNDILEPLFYDTLANDRGHEAWCARFKCRIPFLNGGLFEPLGDYDWKKTDIILPNQLFTNAEYVEEGIFGTGILDVFDRYNFTVNEAEPLEKEVAIDPEMLGKVFENLIEENRRKGLGAFYTPREIVHYMCEESLINYLDTAVNTAEEPLVPQKPKQTKLFGEPEAEQIALKTTIRRELVPRADIVTLVLLGEQISQYETVEAKYDIKMPKSIEKHAQALDSALASITVCDPAVGSGAFPVGMMTEIVRARAALTPHLGDIGERNPYHFKRHAIQNCLYGVDIDSGAVEIAKLRLWLSLIVDEEDVKHVKPLPNLEYKIVVGNSLLGVDKNLFNNEQYKRLEALKPKFFDETNRKLKAQLKEQIEDLIRELTNGRETFDFEIYFSELFHSRNGFDIIIANPPYVRVDEISIAQKKVFKKQFRSAVGKFDLYYLFVERSIQLLRSAGVLVFITPNKYCAASSAMVLREIILSTMKRCEIVSTSKLGVFEQVANYPVISVLQKCQPATRVVVREALALARLRDSTDASYALRHDQFYKLPEKVIPINVGQKKIDFVLGLLEKWPRLGDFFSISEGLRIPVRYEEEAKSDFGIVKQYQFEKWTTIRRGVFISAHNLQSVVSENSHRYCKIMKPKILIAEDALFITATIDQENYIPQGGVYFGTMTTTKMNPKVLLGLLNSNLLSVIYRILFSGMHMGGGYLRYRTSFLEQLPVVDISEKESTKISSLVDIILGRKRRDSEADTTGLEREIDKHVYTIYGLTPEEIKIVEAGS